MVQNLFKNNNTEKYMVSYGQCQFNHPQHVRQFVQVLQLWILQPIKNKINHPLRSGKGKLWTSS